MNTVVPPLSAVYVALVAFIATIVPPGTPVIRGIQNRAPMPMPGFVVIQNTGMRRLSTSVDVYQMTDAPTTATVQQNIELSMQIDCYGPNAGDWAAMISTLLRDPYGCAALAPACQPLYCDDARFMPLVAGEDQWIERWSLDARLQYNPETTIAQQYANALSIELISVTEKFPS